MNYSEPLKQPFYNVPVPFYSPCEIKNLTQDLRLPFFTVFSFAFFFFMILDVAFAFVLFSFLQKIYTTLPAIIQYTIQSSEVFVICVVVVLVPLQSWAFDCAVSDRVKLWLVHSIWVDGIIVLCELDFPASIIVAQRILFIETESTYTKEYTKLILCDIHSQRRFLLLMSYSYHHGKSSSTKKTKLLLPINSSAESIRSLEYFGKSAQTDTAIMDGVVLLKNQGNKYSY